MPAPSARKATPFHPFTGRDVPWLLAVRAQTRADHPFLLWEPHSGAPGRWTYSQFYDETLRVAAGLAAHGVRAGDRVILHMDNCPEFLFAWFGLSVLGAVAVTTNTRCALDEMAYFAAHSGAGAAITQPRYADMIQEALPGARWIACTASDNGEAAARPPGMRAFERFAQSEEPPPVRPAEPMAANSVQYTSGTTSRPKGVVWTHANALWGARINAQHAGLREDDVAFVYMPLFHTNALSFSTLSTLWAGASMVLVPKFSASRFWPVSLKHRCTWASQLMFTVQALANIAPPEKHFYRFMPCASNWPPVQDAYAVTTIGWWGMTETVASAIFADAWTPNAEASMGVPAPEYEVDIVGEDGRSVQFGEIGDLKVRGIPGLSLFYEYLDDPAATAAAFDAEGWFDTGDQVMPLANGHVMFIGRKKDMLKIGGENVAAVEIESVIAGTPGVAEVAVVGKPHPMLDEVAVAFVVAPEPTEALREDILAACRAKLADFKRPHAVVFLDAIPKGSLDKVLKKELRAMAAALA